VEEVIYALASPPPPAPLVLLRLDGDGAAGHIEALLTSKALSGPPRTPRTVDLIWQLDAPPAPVVVIKWKRGASWTGNEGVKAEDNRVWTGNGVVVNVVGKAGAAEAEEEAADNPPTRRVAVILFLGFPAPKGYSEQSLYLASKESSRP